MLRSGKYTLIIERRMPNERDTYFPVSIAFVAQFICDLRQS